MEQENLLFPLEHTSATLERLESSAAMKVLVAEDNPVFQSMLRGMLAKWGYDAVIARDGIEAWHILESSDSPRMAILDWVMPGLDGVELCHRIRAAQREPYIYVLLLSARTEVRELVEAMEAGADDYLTKPFNAHELRVRLRAGRRILDLQEELLRARESLLQQATHDGLTGVRNRVAILDLLEREAERAGREGRPIAVVMADLDHFKSINDTYGHAGGDAVLREVAERMKASFRSYDAIGRYGGEEFLIALPGCALPAARNHAERLREALASTPFYMGSSPVQITCSIGVACDESPCGAAVDTLVRNADSALYKAKNGGRNRVETYARNASRAASAAPATPPQSHPTPGPAM